MEAAYFEEMDLSLTDQMNILREQHGYMTLPEIMALADRGNIIYDPFSVLISRKCQIGSNNYFFPSVSFFCGEEGELVIGNGNIFYTNSLFTAQNGPIIIGSGNQFGEGGFYAKANREGSNIRIGDYGRYLGGASVYGDSDLGSGSQLLGGVSIDNCRLEEGESYRHPDPNSRAGLLKGYGAARDILVPRGSVIIGKNGVFSIDKIQNQADSQV